MSVPKVNVPPEPAITLPFWSVTNIISLPMIFFFSSAKSATVLESPSCIACIKFGRSAKATTALRKIILLLARLFSILRCIVSKLILTLFVNSFLNKFRQITSTARAATTTDTPVRIHIFTKSFRFFMLNLF